MGTETSPQAVRTALNQQDPHDWPQDNDLPDPYCPTVVPRDLCRTFSLYKPRSMFSTLETVFETLIHCLPGVRVTEINSFTSTPLIQWQVAEPGLFGSLEPVILHCWAPLYKTTPRPLEFNIESNIQNKHGISLYVMPLCTPRIFKKEKEGRI